MIDTQTTSAHLQRTPRSGLSCVSEEEPYSEALDRSFFASSDGLRMRAGFPCGDDGSVGSTMETLPNAVVDQDIFDL